MGEYCSPAKEENKMRILGIDPGYAITGYSIIDYQGNKFKLIDSRSCAYKSRRIISIKAF